MIANTRGRSKTIPKRTNQNKKMLQVLKEIAKTFYDKISQKENNIDEKRRFNI